MDNIEQCECGGEMVIDVVDDELEWVCEECGRVDNEDNIVADEEEAAQDSDVEVME